jgi:EF-P beta-lysylation protein EpmB
MPPARPKIGATATCELGWRAELAHGFRNPAELLGALGLRAADCNLAPAQMATDGSVAFPLRVPRGFVARMRQGDPLDPLLLQILPTLAESVPSAGFVGDPVGDLASTRTPGLLQKYAGRALLITTGACAIHCRYCFRREYPYAEHSATASQLGSALLAIAADTSLEEIILSGGDPLILHEQRLENLLEALDRMPHVQRIRLHSRVPVVLPERIDDRLLAVLGRLRARVVVVIHANHANELDEQVARALRALAAVTGTVFNQSVLLRGINDSPEALIALSRALFAAGVIPYYLHQLDPVAGAAHFAVSDAQAKELAAAVSVALPGYLVPRLVRETPGAGSKTPLGFFGTT